MPGLSITITNDDDDARVLRRRHQALIDDLDRLPQPPPFGGRAVVAVTATQTSYPTSVGVYFYCTAQATGGSETEGGSPAFAAGQGFFALHLGPSTTPPASGTKILAADVGGRWAFAY